MICFYILSHRFFLKCEGLSDARVASITKKEYGFVVYQTLFAEVLVSLEFSLCDSAYNLV